MQMKNIPLSADEDLMGQARLIARSQRETLNAASSIVTTSSLANDSGSWRSGTLSCKSVADLRPLRSPR